MDRKLADGLIESNAEFKKLRTQSRGTTPREPGGAKFPGGGGMRRLELESWTREELERAADVLRIERRPGMDRAALIEALLEADATLKRASRP